MAFDLIYVAILILLSFTTLCTGDDTKTFEGLYSRSYQTGNAQSDVDWSIIYFFENNTYHVVTNRKKITSCNVLNLSEPLS